MIVVDDTLLLAVLAGTASLPTLGPDAADVATTGSWYWRLTRAVLDDHSTGSLTQRGQGLDRIVEFTDTCLAARDRAES